MAEGIDIEVTDRNGIPILGDLEAWLASLADGEAARVYDQRHGQCAPTYQIHDNNPAPVAPQPLREVDEELTGENGR